VRKFVSLVAVAAAACVVVAAVSTDAPARGPGTSYTVLQMNLCLSGISGCYPRTAYPDVLDEAAAQVVDHEPQVVTLNETCSGDARAMAHRTGYHLRFAAVRYGAGGLPCVKPGGRGLFGIAVLTRAPIVSSRDQAFSVQADLEERRWVCATTTRAVTACTAHLSTRGTAHARRANDAECRELRGVLARYDAAGTTVFGGDMNRLAPCAPRSMWATEDAAAAQSSGIQHVYGSTTLARPTTEVTAAVHTDHDFLLAAGRLYARPRGEG